MPKTLLVKVVEVFDRGIYAYINGMNRQDKT